MINPREMSERESTLKGLQRTKRGSVSALILSALLLMSLAACGSSYNQAVESSGAYSYYESGAVAEDSYFGEANYYDEPMAPSPANAEKVEETATTTTRKLIKTARLSVETKDYDNCISEVRSSVEALGGYIEYMDSYNGGYYSSSTRNSNFTIRIPEDKLDTFLHQLEGTCNVVDRSENVEDVTLTYVDIESHIKSLRTEMDRLTELLERAESVEDLITVEDRISYVRYQLESYESQMRSYDNQISYSTVSLNIREVKELTVTEEQSAGERIVQGLADSIKDIANGIKEFGIGFVIAIPYLVLMAIVIVIFVLVIRAICKIARRNRENRKNRINETKKNNKKIEEVPMTDSDDSEKNNS